MEKLTNAVIRIITEHLAISTNLVHRDDSLCDLDADDQDVYNILTSIEDVFHLMWLTDDKIKVA